LGDCFANGSLVGVVNPLQRVLSGAGEADVQAAAIVLVDAAGQLAAFHPVEQGGECS
jgi:hypothetical protein